MRTCKTVSARVIVYGASCPACTQAKAVLDRYGIPYEARPMTDFPGRRGRVTTMPQIIIDDELLGGLNQLLGLARAGGSSVSRKEAPIRGCRSSGASDAVTKLRCSTRSAVPIPPAALPAAPRPSRSPPS